MINTAIRRRLTIRSEDNRKENIDTLFLREKGIKMGKSVSEPVPAKKSVFRYAVRAIDGVASLFAGFSSLLMIACAIVVIIDIVARAVGHPTTWGADFSTFALDIFVFLSLANALKDDAHICADIVLSRMNSRMQGVMKAFGLFIALISSSIFSYYEIIWALKSIIALDRTYSYTAILLWPIKLALAVCLVVLTVMAFRLLVAKIVELVRNEKQESFGKGLNNPIIVLPVTIVLMALSLYLFKVNAIVALCLMLITLLLSGTPIAFSIMSVAIATLYIKFGGSSMLANISSISYEFINKQTMLALPMFIFAGNVMARGGLGEDIFNFAKAFVGHITGGLAIAVTIACCIFGALSGSSVACALTIGSIAYPVLVENGYSKRLAAGLIATAGGIGVLIPPSNSFITYGLITGEPIGDLFVAGIIPGLMMTLLLAVVAIILIKKDGGVQKLPKTTWKERALVTKNSIWAIIMPVLVLGSIYTGICTVTEASAIAAVYSVFYSIIIARSISFKEVKKILSESTNSVAFLLLIMIASAMLSRGITLLRLPDLIISLLGNTPGWVFITIIMIFCIFLGCFLEAVAITTLTVPVCMPVLLAYGYDLTWYGVLLTVNLTLAAITPPVGLNLFVMQRIGKLDIMTVVKGAMVFFAAVVVLMIIVALFPQLSLWLPSTM